MEEIADMLINFMRGYSYNLSIGSEQGFDPTQHHDLVLTSSIFDILRDYIINYNYQLLMSTHDSVQANFFKDKLENEGVPSKIYELIVRKNGVIAERIA